MKKEIWVEKKFFCSRKKKFLVEKKFLLQKKILDQKKNFFEKLVWKIFFQIIIFLMKSCLDSISE